MDLLLDDLLAGLYAYVTKKKIRACIALDEFQEITELPESKKIEGILRSHIQFHKEIAYFYVGSRRRILNDMFSNKTRPFYLVQKSVLKALAGEPTLSPYGREFLERHRLSVGGAQRAIKTLLSKDLIEKDPENRHRLTDPVMEAWLGE